MSNNWAVVLSPCGAALSVSRHVASSFLECVQDGKVHIFDSALVLNRIQNSTGSTVINQTIVEEFSKELAVFCLTNRCTRVLVCALAPVMTQVLSFLRSRGIKTGHWFYEDFRRVDHWHQILDGYDHFFAVQRGPLPNACNKSGTHFHFLPTAALSADHARSTDNYDRKWDVAFIGIPSPYRISVLEYLKINGISLCIGGLMWSDYKGLLSDSIVSTSWIDDTQSQYYHSQAAYGLNLSFNDPSVDRDNMQVSPRIFDILSWETRLATEKTPLTEEIFHDSSLFDVFTSPQELLGILTQNVTKKYCRNDFLQQRKLIGEQHTYHQRVERIIEAMV